MHVHPYSHTYIFRMGLHTYKISVGTLAECLKFYACAVAHCVCVHTHQTFLTCVYVCNINVFVRVCMCTTHAKKKIWICKSHGRVHVYTHKYIYIYAHTCHSTHTCRYVLHMCVCMYVCIYIHTHIHTYIQSIRYKYTSKNHVHIFIHMYTFISLCVRLEANGSVRSLLSVSGARK